MIATGLILKGIAGFYYVKTTEGLITCKARGSFRRERITPYIGDRVEVSYDDPNDGVIEKIFARKNFLIRPSVANIDKLFIVVSTTAPSPNRLIIDKTIALAETKNILPILVITKTDLHAYQTLLDIYRAFPVLCVSSLEHEGTQAVLQELNGAISAFTGNSGVGKSTLLNAILPNLTLDTGEISKKLGRGRHTTRHVELFPVGENGYVADTPGFSTLDADRFELLRKEILAEGFREFSPYVAQCQFTSCAHVREKGCAVLEAVAKGLIPASRFESYIAMYNEVKDVKEWQRQKNA